MTACDKWGNFITATSSARTIALLPANLLVDFNFLYAYYAKHKCYVNCACRRIENYKKKNKFLPKRDYKLL
jgi:hypothetical protein